MPPFLALVALACAPGGDGPRPVVAGPGFFDRPFPSDTRMVSGHPDLSDFPLQEEIPLLQRYTEQAPMLDGFGLASPMWVQFEGPLELSALPTPAQSVTSEASVFVVDVDPHSPERGRRIPITWDFNADETDWQPANLLAVQPVWGVPLRPATQYALVLTTAMSRAPKGWTALTDPTDAEHGYLQSLEETLFQLHVSVDDVAYATVFTTQDPGAEMARIVHRMRTGLDATPLDTEVIRETSNSRFIRYRGHLRIPIWQHGEEPYTASGGEFVFDGDGWPELWRMAEVEFTLTIPKNEDMPEGGWPVVIYSHGTTGNRLSFATDASDGEPASQFARSGMAGLGISLPFHGDRYAGSDVELVSFNYLNPDSGRTAFRQAALEQVWLVELLTAGASHLVEVDGVDIWLDPDRVAFMGHSHGAEIGIMAVPFFGDRVGGSVLSSGGGGLSVALLERDAGDFDIQGILSEVLQLGDGEVLTGTHPAVGLVQMIAAATDPLHYARYWFAEQPRWDATPQNVLVFQGLQDRYTPPPTIGALAAAGKVPILDPIAEVWPAQAFVPPVGGAVPLERNVTAWDGSRVTAGVLQYPEHGHFPVFDDEGAMDAYREFLEGAVDGDPEIEAR